MTLFLRRAWTCVLLGLFLPAAAGQEWTGEWPSFRGGEAEAVTETPLVPWASDADAAWTLPLPGRGASSPVVRGGKAYITTAFEEGRATGQQRMASGLRIALLGAVVAFATAHLRRAARGRKARLEGLLVACGIAALIGLETVGGTLLDYERCVIRSWLGASLTASLCLAAAAYRLHARGPLLALGLAGVAFGVFMPLAMPCPDHVFAFGIWTHKAELVLAIAGLPASLGLSCLGRALRFPRRLSLASGVAYGGWLAVFAHGLLAQSDFALPWMLLAGALVLFALALLFAAVVQASGDARDLRVRPARETLRIGLTTALCLGALVVAFELAIVRSGFLSYHFQGGLDWPAPSAWLGAPAWRAGAALVAIAVGLAFGPALLRLGAPLRVAALLLGATLFIDTNVLATQRVFVRAIAQVDIERGELDWVTSALPAPEGQLHPQNTPASPTAVLTGLGPVAHFGAGGLMATDFEGELRWTRPDLCFASIYGTGASVAAQGEHVILAALAPEDGYVCVLDSATGETCWHAEYPGGDFFVSGVSRTPPVVNLRGEDTVLIWCWEGITGFALKSGERLWHEPLPQRSGDMVAGLIVKDGVLYAAAKMETLAYDLERLGTGEDAELWRHRGGPNCSTPVVDRGRMLYVSDGGIATCLDARDGQRLWRERLSGEVFASPISFDGTALVATLTGTVHALDLGAESQEVFQAQHEGALYASPVPAAGGVLLRQDTRLTFFRGPSEIHLSDARDSMPR